MKNNVELVGGTPEPSNINHREAMKLLIISVESATQNGVDIHKLHLSTKIIYTTEGRLMKCFCQKGSNLNVTIF